MKVRFFNIVWDTDGEEVDLPVEVEMVCDPDLDLDEEGADVLSDKYGFCVVQYECEIL